MEDFIQNISLKVEGLPSHDLIRTFTSSLTNEKGIRNVLFDNQTFTIDFNPYVISKEEIIHEMEEAGIQACTCQKKEKGFKKWISNLALQNKKNLGSHRLDCCDMNH